MESKTSKQRIIKTSSTKSVTPVEQSKTTEKLVLKPETVVEVKSNKGKKATSNNVVPLKQEQTVEAPAKQVAGNSSKSVEPVKEAVSKPVKETTVKAVKEAGAKVVKATVTKAVKEAGAKVVKATKAAKATKAVKVTKEVTAKTDNLVQNEVEDNEEPESGKLRYFKLYYNNDICGRYCGKKPKQAANKAFSSIIKDMKKTDKKEGINVDISFSIKECTRNSSHKEYKYVGKRLLLTTPVKVKIENDDGSTKEIVYKFHNELKKAPKV
jgi:hypothetical protein